MGSLAYLFPGQGSQQPAMGAQLLEDGEVAALCEACSKAAEIDLRKLLTDTPDEELKLTQNAQPALCFTGIALALLLKRRGIIPQATAGHSVGEYAALCVAGAIGPEDAIKAVVERGRAMAEAAPPGTSSMIAVLGIGPEEIEVALLGVPDVWPANYNTPTQTVVGGTMLGLERAGQRLLEAGARRVIPLNVSAAFHTPLMEPAADYLRGALSAVGWSRVEVPVIANVTGEPYDDTSLAPSMLEMQLRSPVRWGDGVRSLSGLGVTTFLELGPKRALSGMMRELAPEAFAAPVGDPAAVTGLSIP